MYGKTCLITGATSGIGRATTRALAERGARVVIVGRSEVKCAATAAAITQQTGNREVEYLVADLSVQAQVRALADEIRRRYAALDVLVNNAGGIFLFHQQTRDGIEMTFALNHLAYFLLTNLVLDRLRSGSRVVNVSSDAHRMGRLDFDDVRDRRRYFGYRAYAESKLANVLFTYGLARRLEGRGVTVNAMHPGLVATGFGQNNGLLGRAVWDVVNLFALKPEQGARTAIYLASSPEVEGVTGRYFYRERPVTSSPASYDAAAAERLWRVSEEMTGLAG